MSSNELDPAATTTDSASPNDKNVPGSTRSVYTNTTMSRVALTGVVLLMVPLTVTESLDGPTPKIRVPLAQPATSEASAIVATVRSTFLLLSFECGASRGDYVTRPVLDFFVDTPDVLTEDAEAQ